MRVVCDGLERCCGVSVVHSMCGIRCKMRHLLEIIECSKLTLAAAVPHMCNCGVIWRIMVLGVERLWTGAKEFCGGLEGGGSDVCWADL